ncbi:MAG: hypothetical protein LBC57_04695 [Treponema sp.]|nr:hypothetical protein [Treponema sp.]
MKRFFSGILLCVAGCAANYALRGFSRFLGTGLFLDTVFTISVTLSGGIWAGFFTAIISTICFEFPWNNSWAYFLFGICSLASACLTWIFIRLFPRECGSFNLWDDGAASVQGEEPTLLDRFVMLLLFCLAMCALISVLGGLIAVFIETVIHVPITLSPETYFKLGLLRQGLNLVTAEILARLPINIVDRLISVFVAYGAALLLKRGAGKFLPPKKIFKYRHS